MACERSHQASPPMHHRLSMQGEPVPVVPADGLPRTEATPCTTAPVRTEGGRVGCEKTQHPMRQTKQRWAVVLPPSLLWLVAVAKAGGQTGADGSGGG